jgi:hypothetical protein
MQHQNKTRKSEPAQNLINRVLKKGWGWWG